MLDLLVLRINLFVLLLIPWRLPAGLNLIFPDPVLEKRFFTLLFVFSLGIKTPLLKLQPLGCPAGHSKFGELIDKLENSINRIYLFFIKRD